MSICGFFFFIFLLFKCKNSLVCWSLCNAWKIKNYLFNKIIKIYYPQKSLSPKQNMVIFSWFIYNKQKNKFNVQLVGMYTLKFWYWKSIGAIEKVTNVKLGLPLDTAFFLSPRNSLIMLDTKLSILYLN